MFGPARHLGLKVIEGVENGQVFIERALLGEVIVLQRDFPSAIEAYEEILAQARQKLIPVILDLDDLLFVLPEDHPDRLKHIFTGTLLPTFQAMLEVDGVTVTTQPLCDFIRGYNKNVMVLPNYLDDQIWQLKPPVRKPNPDDKLKIGYMGGLSHQPDLALLVPVFRNLLRRFPDRLEFHFWGAEPPGEFSTNPGVHKHAEITWIYPDFAAYFQTQSADIFVAPLANNTFNNCKSSIKYLEYGSLGVPGVFSKVEPYSDVISHGENGFLAASAEEWEDCLVQLIENPELRFTLAANAQAEIQAHWLLSRNAPLWIAAYQKSSEISAHQTAGDSMYLGMIRNLSHQTVSWQRDTKHQLELQRNRITELEDLVARRDVTISGITNSKTWKLALVFRRIRELIAPPESRRTKIFGRIVSFIAAPFKR
ncbi:MAG: hypothetical protein A2030_06830 [Chloroflexi bacterium RBG_19FT_COMBO_50_10]|nr:MAG: hypothetical protein A2030_06830 [Chloroflexi bacterium RBG_19FT_COMBO_50_10]